MMVRGTLAMTATLAALGACGLSAQPHGGDAGHALGRVRFPVSCTERAQDEFDHAVVLLHHMTYPRAREAFERVAETDPRCAMAHWGIAMTLFQPLWPTRPGAAERRRGWQAVLEARALGVPTERERLFVAAAAAFFGDPETDEYWPRIRRWEHAMRLVHDAYPDDSEAAAFYALALLAVAPADTVATDHGERAAQLLLGVYHRHPHHPGAMHYLVHANDAPGRQHESLEIVREYETVAPRNPHALHMPTHIYTRLGDWEAVIRGNLRAAEAALEHPAGDRGQFVWDEFPHAIEYLVYAHLQRGADTGAAAAIARLLGTGRLEPTFKTAFHLASTRVRYALERHAWSEAAALVPRDPPLPDWDRFTWPEAITWFGRGLGAAHTGALDDAQAALGRLATLEAAAAAAGERLWERNIRVLLLELGAWTAAATGPVDSALALMRQAADLELATPKHAVTPAPTLPAHELWGDLLMAAGRPAEALAAYRRSLEHYPRRFNSVLGAARAARAAGDRSAAGYYQELLDLGGGTSSRASLREARAFVDRRY